MITLDEFKEKHLGESLDWDKNFGAQCVDLYRFYVSEVLGFPQSPGVRGAADIWTTVDEKYFEKIPNTLLGVPRKGDIMIWNTKAGGGYGHVGVVLEAGVMNFTSLDQNWSQMKVTVETHSYSNTIGWLRPKIQTMDCLLPNTPEFRDLYERLLAGAEKINKLAVYLGLGDNADKVSYDTFEQSIGGLKGRVTEFQNKAGEAEGKLRVAQQEIKNREEQVSRLENDLIKMEEAHNLDITELNRQLQNYHLSGSDQWQEKYQEAQSKYNEAMKDKGRILLELADAQSKLDSNLESQLEGKSLWELLQLVLSKIRI